MRTIIERWYMGPIVAAVALFGCWISSLGTATTRVADITRANLERIYGLAGKGQYDEILREGLASAESVDYLKMQDACFGRPTACRVAGVVGGSFGIPWRTVIGVDRPAITVIDVATGSDPHTARIALDANQNDLQDRMPGDPQAWVNPYVTPRRSVSYPTERPIDSTEQATSVARTVLHQLDAAEHIRAPLGVTRSGDYWVITERVITLGGLDERYLVLSQAGAVVERLRHSQGAVD